MHPVALIFGLAVAGAIVLAWRTTCVETQIMALLMAMVWATANLLAHLDALEWLAFVDLPVAALAYVLWFERRETWAAWLVTAFAARLAMHLLAALGVIEWVPYLHTINALFLCALVSIGWKGGIGAAIGHCRRGLRGARLSLAGDQRLAEAARVKP